MLGLSCRLVIFLMGKRISSICIVFFLKSNTTPNLCKVSLPMMRSYIGASTPELYSTQFGFSRIFLLVEYSIKDL